MNKKQIRENYLLKVQTEIREICGKVNFSYFPDREKLIYDIFQLVKKERRDAARKAMFKYKRKF